MGLNSIKTHYPPQMHEKWRSCYICEGARTIRAEIKFKQGTTEPAINATLTGQTSGATGVIKEIELLSGTWTEGNAAGYITMTSPTGIDSDGHWGKDGETAMASGGGSVVLDGKGTQKIYALLYPEKDMIYRDGRWYCKWHGNFRFRKRDEDANRMSINDRDF